MMAWSSLGRSSGSADGGAFHRDRHGSARHGPDRADRHAPDADVDAASALDQILRSVDLTGVDVDPRIVHGLPAPALLDAAADADLLVVGARGMGGFRGLLLGSVSHQCVHHATVPVAIVRACMEADQSSDERPLVVGVDGSKSSQRALEWAVAEAAARRTELVALHARWPVIDPPIGATAGEVDDLDAEAEAMVRGALEDAGAPATGVPVEVMVLHGSAAAGLLEVARTASLLVVGSRGHGGFRGLLLGSVSQHVVHHAPCVTVVVPGPH